MKYLRCSVFLANILNQNNTHIKNFELVKTCMEGYIYYKTDQFGTEVCLEKDRKMYHAKSKPHGDMVASIFDMLTDGELNMQN